MKIYIPEDIIHLENEIKTFVDAMIYKLNKNAHKGKWENLNLSQLRKLLQEEIDELDKAISDGNAVEILLELSDISNFAMMIANVAIRDASENGGK